MNPLLRDFCRHQAWADAEHWRAIEAHPLSAEDPAPAWQELEAPIANLTIAAVARNEAMVLALLQRLEPAFRPGSTTKA